MPVTDPTTVILDGPVTTASGSMPSGSLVINVDERLVLVGPAATLAHLAAAIGMAVAGHYAEAVSQ